MKIDEQVINENALTLIEDIANLTWEMDSKDDMMLNLGIIQGICELARSLKDTLNTKDGDIKNEE